MKKYRFYFENVNNGDELFIDVNSSNEILPALQNNPQYVEEPENWECIHSEEIKE